MIKLIKLQKLIKYDIVETCIRDSDDFILFPL